MKYCKLIFAPRIWGALLLVALFTVVPGPTKVQAATVTGNGTSCVAAPVSSSFPRTTTGSVSRTLAIRCFISPTDTTNDAMRTRITDGNQTGETIDVASIHSAGNSVALQTGTSATFTNLRWGLLTNSNASTIAASDSSLPDDYFEADLTYAWNWGGNTRTENSHVIVVLFGRTLAAGTQQHVVTCNSLLSPDPSSYGAAPCARAAAADDTWRTNGADLNDWGDPYVPPVQHLCEAIGAVGFELEGDALGVADYDNTFMPALSDDVVGVLTVGGDLTAEEAQARLSFRYRFGTEANWGTLIPIAWIDVSGGSALTFKPRSFGDQYLSQLAIECTDSESEDDPATRVWWGGDPGPNVNDPLWSEAGTFWGACVEMFVQLPSPARDIEEGDVVNVPYTLGGDEGVDVTVMGAGWVTQNFAVASYSLLGVQTGGDTPFTFNVAPGRGTLRFTVPDIKPEFEDVNSTVDLGFYCSDGYGEDGTRVQGSTGQAGFEGRIDTEVDSISECWNTTRMSLTNPSSWIAGAARMLACVAQQLAVPDSAVMLAEVEDFNATLEGRPPFVAFYVVLDFAEDLNSSFNSSSGTGCFSAGSIPGVSAPTDICAAGTVEPDTGQRSLMALFFTAPMILGMAAHMLGLIRGNPDVLEESSGQLKWNI